MECPICWESLVSTSSPTISIPCGHLFHEGCLSPVLRSRLSNASGGDPDCPTCRAPIKLITGHDRDRIPNTLREQFHPAIRRVYLTPPDASSIDTQRETEYLYARLAETQESLQKSKQKEKSAEQRLRAIMDLWKQEQAKNAELQRSICALKAEQAQRVAKTSSPPAPSSYVPPPPLPLQSVPPVIATATDPWHMLEQEIIVGAVQRFDNMWRVVPPPVPSYPYLPPMPPTALPSDFQMLPVGSSYQQAMQPVPQHASMLQQNSMSVPMSPVPVPSVAAQPAPISGINPPYSVAAQPQLHYAPAPMSHTFGHVPQAPVQSPVADPHVNPAQFRSAGAPSASTDPRPRHLSGAARDRELARIRLQMHHARLQQAMVQQASQQGMPSTSQR